jgi:hypothetical protein
MAKLLAKSVFWCGRCGLWNSHHPTLEHLTSSSPTSLHAALLDKAGETGSAYPIAAINYAMERHGDRDRNTGARPYVTFAKTVASSLCLQDQDN